MKTKKIYISILIIILLNVLFIKNSYATPPYSTEMTDTGTQPADTTMDNSWLTEAFSAAKEFLSTDSIEIPHPLDIFLAYGKYLIRGINRVLWVLLAGISAISLSIVGINYILGINSSTQRKKAKEDLHVVIKGMAIGFGALLIFNVAMTIIRIIIESM